LKILQVVPVAATLVLRQTPMKAHVVALALLLPTLALGAAACGGSGGHTTTKISAAEQHRLEERWRTGLIQWHRTTQSALDGISIIFSTQASLDNIRKEGTRDSTSLAVYEAALAQCSRTLSRLGPVPATFALAGRYAVRACANLEKGEHAVEGIVGSLRHGGGFNTLDPLSNAGNLLSTGQAELTTAMHALQTGSA
jgi:hypothetical protein